MNSTDTKEMKAAYRIVARRFLELINQFGEKGMYFEDDPEYAGIIEGLQEVAPECATVFMKRLLVFYAEGFSRGIEFARDAYGVEG